MNKVESVIDDKFCAMFICNFRESITLRRSAENKGK